MKLEVKPFSIDMMPQCTELFIKVFNSEPWNDKWTLESAKKLFEDYCNFPGAGHFVGISNETIVAVSFGRTIHWWNSSEYFIEELFVTPSVQNQGLGSSFLSSIESLLKSKGIGRITLLTARETQAEAFYKKNGFSNVDFLTYMAKDL